MNKRGRCGLRRHLVIALAASTAQSPHFFTDKRQRNLFTVSSSCCYRRTIATNQLQPGKASAFSQYGRYRRSHFQISLLGGIFVKHRTRRRGSMIRIQCHPPTHHDPVPSRIRTTDRSPAAAAAPAPGWFRRTQLSNTVILLAILIFVLWLPSPPFLAQEL